MKAWFGLIAAVNGIGEVPGLQTRVHAPNGLTPFGNVPKCAELPNALTASRDQVSSRRRSRPGIVFDWATARADVLSKARSSGGRERRRALGMVGYRDGAGIFSPGLRPSSTARRVLHQLFCSQPVGVGRRTVPSRRTHRSPGAVLRFDSDPGP